MPITLSEIKMPCRKVEHIDYEWMKANSLPNPEVPRRYILPTRPFKHSVEELAATPYSS